MNRLPIALSLLLAAGAARADKNEQAGLIARARTEMSQLNYDAAIALLEQAEASGQNGRDQVIEILRATAESHAAMGRTDAAEVAFRRLLALDPAIELPDGSSPKLTAPFTAAREFLAGRVVAIQCRSGEGEVTLVVQSDPVDLVAGARLTGNGEAAVGADARGQGRIRLAMPAGGEARGCAALDRHGNFLVGAELSAAAAGPEPSGAGTTTAGITAPAGGSEAEGRPIYARWWLYGGVAAISAGVAVYYGLKVSSTEDDLDALHQRTLEEPDHDITYADALALEDRGERYARNTNIAIGVTALFAAVSGGLLIHELVTRDRADESAARVGAGPLPGGAGVHVSLGF